MSDEARGAEPTPATPADEFPSLIHQASRAAFWNALLLPLLAVLNLAFAVIVRRRFGLFSGVYDITLGLSAALLLYSSVGIPTSLTKFLPEVETTRGAAALVRFLRRAAAFRLLLLVVPLVPLNLLAEPIAERLDLGTGGTAYLRLLSVLAIARAVVDLVSKTLNSFFAQLWSNGLALGQAALDFALVIVMLLLGYGMGGVLGALMASSVLLALIGTGCVRHLLRRVASRSSVGAPDEFGENGSAFAGEGSRFFRFTSFTYLFELSLFFTGMGFAGPALAVVLDREQVALFATGFKLALMTVTVVVAAFRGLYRPIFSRVMIRDDPSQLQRTFVAVSKAQLVVLIPAGVGLAIMSGDYVPLLFGVAFQSAVPIAQILVGLLYAETAFNLGVIVLSVDERYRAVFWAQSVLVGAAPFFLMAAAYQGLLWAAAVFGGARLTSVLLGYLFCRQAYGFRFPWAFAGRVAMVSLIMGAVLVAGKTLWATSPAEAVTLTLAGVLMFGLGLRVAKVLGLEEVELLHRAQLPGYRWVLAWLAPAGQGAAVK